MIIQTTKSFDKQYRKLQPKIKERFKQRLGIFTANPFDISLRNHAPKGKYLGYKSIWGTEVSGVQKYLGYRSINITGDVRALYTVKEGALILFVFIGTHSQLY
jgi:mRNA-degrading endonuclease YafQ of YafQ-DinJ toxin-antitoxin module